ncbi:LacI family DNA-binding transcriptional regulator [Paracoccus limosus]|jgi:LacI family fructose operon transcriptional repressor|uniref:LacI family DNA-binding transcriptional regulator n=1 Tax=Paracoccus limosus TaxID=913252 RepID=A0A844H5V6_9RHOB|nr:LacI family DNA-binding transcriptional regulator [Paracoccus limosus]MTH34984.1 LacI family DNA-binding transcriptional regulator [Paracoccus limosus]
MTVGIKDVARAAGVAPSTVSRALGKGPVSADVRRKVEAAVAATGYRPNLAARQLRSQQSMTVGLIVADIRNPFFTQLSRAVEDEAYRAGMRVFLCNTDEDPAREAMYLELMAEERVAGLILAPTRALSRSALADFRVPVVLVDRNLPGGRRDAVILDNAGATALLVDHLIETGRKRIAGLFGATSATGIERRDAFQKRLIQHGLEPLAATAPPSAETGRAALEDLLAREKPDALVLSNGLFVGAALQLCRDRGIRIPAELALAGFDDEAWTSLVEPGITVIRQPVDVFGREAMLMLLSRISRPDQPVRTVTLSGELVPRGSTAALRRADV